jgi:mannose-6-phosphate isomerase-like protein (cupin superfamily)
MRLGPPQLTKILSLKTKAQVTVFPGACRHRTVTKQLSLLMTAKVRASPRLDSMHSIRIVQFDDGEDSAWWHAMNASDETYLVLKGTSQHGDDKNS